MDSIPILQTPSPQPMKGPDGTGRSSTPGASFLALIEGFLGPAGEQAPPSAESPEPEAGAGRGEGMAALVPPGLFLEAATDTAAALAGGLAPQPQQPAGEDMPAADADAAADGQDMAGDAPTAPGIGPPSPTARSDGPPAGTGLGGASPAGPPSPAAASTPTAEPAAAGPPKTAMPVADPAAGGSAASETLPAETAAETKVAADPQNGGGPGTGSNGRDGDGRAAGRPDAEGAEPPRNVLREETGTGFARSGDIPDDAAKPQRDAAPGQAPRTAAAPPPSAAGVAEPPAPTPAPAAAPPAGTPGAEAAAAAGAVRMAGEPAAAAPSAGFAPSAGHGQANPPHPASQMVSVTLSRMADGRADRMTIQLRPAELGTVEVKLDFRGDGTVQAMIVADRAETLGLLQRDAPTLEKALQEAGLKTDSQGLSFSLRDGGEGERNFTGFHQAFAKTRNRGGPAADDGAQTLTLVAGQGSKDAPGRVDIRI